MSCVLLKKYFLDSRATPDFQPTELSASDIQSLLESVIHSCEFDSQPLLLLKRKCEVLAKLYSKLGQQDLFIQMLAQESQQAQEKRRQFAMYGFEIMSELHLTSEQMTANKADFQAIFTRALEDQSIQVNAAALKAITAFLSGIDDQDVVMEFEPILSLLIKTVKLALSSDEETGRQALESLGELTGAHPEVWKNNTDNLLLTVTAILQDKELESGTRSAAIEVVLSLSEEMPAALRKSAVTS